MHKIENQDYFKGKAQIEILKTELLLTLSPAKGEKVVSEHVHALFTHNWNMSSEEQFNFIQAVHFNKRPSREGHLVQVSK